jgi:hypothetical protein
LKFWISSGKKKQLIDWKQPLKSLVKTNLSNMLL